MLGPGVLCNAVFHLGASGVTRSYCPGAVTGLLVYLPHHTEIVAARSGMPYVRAVHELIRDVGRRDGVTLVDLTEAFRTEAAAGAVLTFPSDEHWTPAGHQLVADVLLQSGAVGPAPPAETRAGS